MTRHSLLTVSSILALCASAAAQLPTPNPLPRVKPRAEWVATTGVTGTVPANRHWSQAAGNDTSLFVFGGRTGTSGSGSKRNDLFEFDATTLAWTQHNADGDPNAPLQRYRNTLTDPAASTGHNCDFAGKVHFVFILFSSCQLSHSILGF